MSASYSCLSCIPCTPSLFLFFFYDPPTPEIYTLSLHDALPISSLSVRRGVGWISYYTRRYEQALYHLRRAVAMNRSEEHTSELQSRQYLVCRLLLEKKKQ